MDIKILGIDLAKNVFQLCALSLPGWSPYTGISVPSKSSTIFSSGSLCCVINGARAAHEP